jgi:hypothetical protein
VGKAEYLDGLAILLARLRHALDGDRQFLHSVNIVAFQVIRDTKKISDRRVIGYGLRDSTKKMNRLINLPRRKIILSLLNYSGCFLFGGRTSRLSERVRQP